MARRMLCENQIRKIAREEAGSVTPEGLAEVLEGSNTVVVDLNLEGDKLQVSLDQDVIEEIDGKQDLITNDNKLSADLVVATNTQTVQENLERIDESVGDLIDDVADLNSNKLDASKAAVSTVGGLVVPNSAPATDKLVGIDTSNGQELVSIGSGLSLVNGELTATGGGGGSTVSVSLSGTSTNDVKYITIDGTEYRIQQPATTAFYVHTTQIATADANVNVLTFYVTSTKFNTMSAFLSAVKVMGSTSGYLKWPCTGKFKDANGNICTATAMYAKSSTSTFPTIVGVKDSDLSTAELDLTSTTPITDVVSSGYSYKTILVR